MNVDLKELLFAQLQALSRAYQAAVSIMSAYEREFERLEKARAAAEQELTDARGAADVERATLTAALAEARAGRAVAEDEARAARSELEVLDDPVSAV